MTKLEFIRRQHGISQTALGRIIGIHPTVIVQIERHHRRSYPKIRRKLADYFDVDESVLFDEKGWAKQVEYNPVA
jgi:DNA-binding XRE family transcriptional regulator